MSACTQRVLEHLRALGASVSEDISIPNLLAVRTAHAVTIGTEMGVCMAPYMNEHARELGYATQINLAIASSATASDFLTAQRVRTLAMQALDAVFARVDILVTPATGVTAPAIDESALPQGVSSIPTLMAIMQYATLANMTGHPSLVVPAGVATNGLPTAVQVCLFVCYLSLFPFMLLSAYLSFHLSACLNLTFISLLFHFSVFLSCC